MSAKAQNFIRPRQPLNLYAPLAALLAYLPFLLFRLKAFSWLGDAANIAGAAMIGAGIFWVARDVAHNRKLTHLKVVTRFFLCGIAAAGLAALVIVGATSLAAAIQAPLSTLLTLLQLFLHLATMYLAPWGVYAGLVFALTAFTAGPRAQS
ncbi:MAG: hypothetical protein AB7O04_15335 [Hyphomonadaceae bacterium]